MTSAAPEPLLPCPCCGSLSVDEPGQYEVCAICGWEDDPVQSADPSYGGGANAESLQAARASWKRKSEQPLTIELVSVPDRDDLVAEVWLGQSLLAELRQEGGQLRVQLYPNSSGQPWDLPVEDLCSALAKASAKLSGNDKRCT